MKRQSDHHVPILMYHSICDDLRPIHPYYETNTAPELFEQHMKFLQENGYHTVSMGDACRIITGGNEVENPVVVTFDDGYLDFHSRALPVLLKYGFRATAFVVTDFVERPRVGHNGRRYMNWQEVREIHAAGMEVGSHTTSHPELHNMSHAQVEYELRKSKDVIEQELSQPVSSFAYPYNFPEQDREFVTMLRDCLALSGYENGVCTMIGTASRSDDLFFLPRVPVNSYDDLRLFRAKLEGGYDWLHTPQKIYKSLLKRSSGAQLATAGSR